MDGSNGIRTPNLTRSQHPLLVGPLLSNFLPAQLRLSLCSYRTAIAQSRSPLLTRHRHSSVLTSSAHSCAQTPSKCCSGCSPSPHPSSVLVLGPYHNWIPAPCPYLSSHEFDQLYAILCQDPIWGTEGPTTCHLRETGHSVFQ